MKCTRIDLGGGMVGIACGRSRPRARCQECRDAPHDFLCDWKLGTGRTCDRKICASCSTSPTKGKDLCCAHAAEWAAHPRNPRSAPRA